MYFRLCNLPVTFQLIMDSMLWELINTEKIIVYIRKEQINIIVKKVSVLWNKDWLSKYHHLQRVLNSTQQR